MATSNPQSEPKEEATTIGCKRQSPSTSEQAGNSEVNSKTNENCPRPNVSDMRIPQAPCGAPSTGLWVGPRCTDDD